MTDLKTMTLWRPCGPAELELVRESGWTAWPPRLPEQPIFYPVLNEDYATKIARDWNAARDGVGYVTRFEVDAGFAERYPVQQAGGRTILELWVPAEDLEAFNRHIIGRIDVVAEVPRDRTLTAAGVGTQILSRKYWNRSFRSDMLEAAQEHGLPNRARRRLP